MTMTFQNLNMFCLSEVLQKFCQYAANIKNLQRIGKEFAKNLQGFCKVFFGVLFDTYIRCTGEFLCSALFYHPLDYFLLLCAFWKLVSEVIGSENNNNFKDIEQKKSRRFTIC